MPRRIDILAMMVSRVPFLIVFIAAAAFGIVVVTLVWIAWRRRRSLALAAGPVCGACGYHLAPMPGGLTVCPECGGDFLSVGILAPKMKLGRRASPAVPLGIAWFLLVGAGMVPLHNQLMVSFTRMMSVSTVNQTASGQGPFKKVAVVWRREQFAGERSPDLLEGDVTITGPDGKDLSFTVDGKSKTIAKARPQTGLQGLAWDGAAAKKALAAAGSPDAEADAADKARSVVDDALEKTSGGGSFGGISAFSSSSSTSAGFFSGSRRSRSFIESGASSSFSSTMTPVVVIGPLRGAHWVTAIVCAAGLLLAVVGTWLIAAVTKPRERLPATK